MAKKTAAAKQEAQFEDIGGVFIYANDARKLSEWYQDKLGLELAGGDCGDGFQYCRVFEKSGGASVFAIKPAKSKLPAERDQCVVNFRISDFAALAERLKSKGVAVEKSSEDDYGYFGSIKDLEGNSIELWQSK